MDIDFIYGYLDFDKKKMISCTYLQIRQNYLHTRVIWKVRSMASKLLNALIKCYKIIHFCLPEPKALGELI